MQSYGSYWESKRVHTTLFQHSCSSRCVLQRCFILALGLASSPTHDIQTPLPHNLPTLYPTVCTTYAIPLAYPNHYSLTLVLQG